jgi:serine/threonine protein kinase
VSLLCAQHLTIAKVIDFGYSNSFDNDNAAMETRCGSPHYVAPEMLLGQRYGPKVCRDASVPLGSSLAVHLQVDVWSLGISLYVCLMSAYPFDGSPLPQLYDAIVRKPFTAPRTLSAGAHLLSAFPCAELTPSLADSCRGSHDKHARKGPWQAHVFG